MVHASNTWSDFIDIHVKCSLLSESEHWIVAQTPELFTNTWRELGACQHPCLVSDRYTALCVMEAWAATKTAPCMRGDQCHNARRRCGGLSADYEMNRFITDQFFFLIRSFFLQLYLLSELMQRQRWCCVIVMFVFIWQIFGEEGGPSAYAEFKATLCSFSTINWSFKNQFCDSLTCNGKNGSTAIGLPSWSV